MKTLYLHIGTPKTATTTIQKFCVNNRQVLESKGYIYPEMPFQYYVRGQKQNKNRNGMFLGSVIKDENGERLFDEETIKYEEGMKIIHSLFQTYDNIILSEERLWVVLRFREAEFLKDLVARSKADGFRIKMIIYLRRQDDFFESIWKQQVKMHPNFTKTAQEYLEEYWHLDYHDALWLFADMIGEENISVRRFREVVKGPGMVADFMEQIGLELTDEYLQEDDDLNPGLYGNLAEIKLVINELDGLTPRDSWLFRKSIPLSTIPAREHYPCSIFSDEDRAALMQPLEAENNAIADRFIGDGKPLFSEDYHGLPKWSPDNPEMLHDVIRFSAGSDVILYRQLHDHMAKNRDQFREMNTRIKELEKLAERQAKQIERQANQIDHLKHPLQSLLRRAKK